MKILLVINKTMFMGIKRLDNAYYNFYIPLLSLGHEVCLYDMVDPIEPNLQKVIEQFQPELIFSCITGNHLASPYEQIHIIEQETKKGNIKTFNWFCDDTWRFEDFSSEECWKFTCCSTPEPSFLREYKEIGYNNILLGFWHVNGDLCVPSVEKQFHIGFCGIGNEQREAMFQKIAEKIKIPNLKIQRSYYISYEDVLSLYSFSHIGLNLCQNENDKIKKTQMKLRMIEVPAAGSLLLTEYTQGIESLFEIDKEIATFTTEEEMIDKLDYYLRHSEIIRQMSQKARQRFLRDHESRVRLFDILEQIKKI